jgi:hypothetical protein
MRDQQFASTGADVPGIDEQRLDRIVREAEKPQGHAVVRVENPPGDRRLRELQGDEWPQVENVVVRQEPMRGSNRPFPQLDESRLIFGARPTDAHCRLPAQAGLRAFAVPEAHRDAHVGDVLDGVDECGSHCFSPVILAPQAVFAPTIAVFRTPCAPTLAPHAPCARRRRHRRRATPRRA